MKKFLLLLLAAAMFSPLSAKELKVLMIGNSFSESVLIYLPQMVEAGKSHKLYLVNAFIGGCTLERHCRNIDREEKKPGLKPYSYSSPGEPVRKENLSDIIKSRKWDIISIQQGSTHSPYKEKTHAFAAKLIAHVKKLAPQAEIVVHQTWAYRGDHSWFTGKNAVLTRDKMHQMLTANYTELAKNNKFRMIPVGNAIQLFREKLPVKTVKYTQEDLKKLVYPATIDVTGGDVVGAMKWRKDRTDKSKKVIGNDLKHLNEKGQYLQACVWYMFLFDEPATGIKLPFDSKDHALLLKCADEAIKNSKK